LVAEPLRPQPVVIVLRRARAGLLAHAWATILGERAPDCQRGSAKAAILDRSRFLSREGSMPERPVRLGDVVDDYCPRCRLLLNHDVASLTGSTIAKVTCRTCHNTHDYRQGQAPARRKSSKKPDNQALMDQVLAGLPMPPSTP